MHLHILSDLHLESGPFPVPDNLSCDVVVAAGDIGEDLLGIEFLKTLPIPAIYVLGNHEFYSRHGDADMDDTLERFRAAAAGTNVHVLEQDAVVIGGVRFLGTTLWTNYGNAHRGLLHEALDTQNDYRCIGARRWFDDADNIEKFLQLGQGTWNLEQLSRSIEEKRFHPLVGLDRHNGAIAWLQRQLEQPFDGDTVVVTHQHPSFESLRRYGVDELILTHKELWNRRGLSDDNERYRVASYASDLNLLLCKYRHRIALWVCGHLHGHLDYLHQGVRIVCNPRGVSLSSREESAEPGAGTGRGFDPRFTVDLDEGIRPVIEDEVAAIQPSLACLHEEARAFAERLAQSDPLVHRAVAESLEARAVRFEQTFAGLLDRLGRYLLINPADARSVAMQLRWFGLPQPPGPLRLDLDSPFPRDVPLAELAQRLLTAQAECLDLLPQLSTALDRRQEAALERLEALRTAIEATGIRARIEVPARIRRPWRDAHWLLADVTIEDEDGNRCDEVEQLAERILNPDPGASGLRQFIINVRSAASGEVKAE